MNKRRDFLKLLAGGTAIISMPTLLSFVKVKNLPIRALTSGPNYHWFGYYDKLQFDPSNRYVLCMEVDFEMRSPRKDDVIKMAYIDLQQGDEWTEIGESHLCT